MSFLAYAPQNGTRLRPGRWGASGHLGKVMPAVQRAGVLSALACSPNDAFVRNHSLL